MRITSVYETVTRGEGPLAAVRHAVPLADGPPIDECALQPAIAAAELSLARLDVVAGWLPSIEGLFLSMLRKEAVGSAQLEGARVALADLWVPGELTSAADVDRVHRQIDALTWARGQLMRGVPVSLALLREVSAQLTAGVGEQPAQITPYLVADMAGDDLRAKELAEWEQSLRNDEDSTPIVRAGLLYGQLLALNPYGEHNGEIARLLIALFLEHERVLHQPLLLISGYFAHHRVEYATRLAALHTDNDRTAWLQFFLRGVVACADEAVELTRELARITAEDRARLIAHPDASVAAVRLFELLIRQPMVTISAIVGELDMSKPTAGRAVDILVSLRILSETTGKKRDRTFAYARYSDKLRAGSELFNAR